MKHTITLALALASFWWLNSSHTTPLMLSLAAISILLVLYIAHRMDAVDHDPVSVPLSPKIPGYLLWLTKEVIFANISVAKHILLGAESISPTMAKIKTSQKTDFGKVTYANSITLTPGTIAVKLENGHILVHALLRESIDDLKAGEMDRRALQVEV